MKNPFNTPVLMMIIGSSMIMISLFHWVFMIDSNVEDDVFSFPLFWIGLIGCYTGFFILIYRIKKIWKDESY